MKYTDKSFTVPVGGDAYRENFDRIFRKKEIEPGDRTRAPKPEVERTCSVKVLQRRCLFRSSCCPKEQQ